MDSNQSSGLGIDLLNQSNFKVWKSCMESYLLGEDLREVVGGDEIATPTNTQEIPDALKKWKVRNAKAEFTLKKSISRELFEHITDHKSTNAIWTTLDGLFNKKNEGRLQLLENDLAN